MSFDAKSHLFHKDFRQYEELLKVYLSCVAIANISKQSSLEFLKEFMLFIKADNFVSFYELFILCS
jgi:hypothetical protein